MYHKVIRPARMAGHDEGVSMSARNQHLMGLEKYSVLTLWRLSLLLLADMDEHHCGNCERDTAKLKGAIENFETYLRATGTGDDYIRTVRSQIENGWRTWHGQD